MATSEDYTEDHTISERLCAKEPEILVQLNAYADAVYEDLEKGGKRYPSIEKNFGPDFSFLELKGNIPSDTRFGQTATDCYELMRIYQNRILIVMMRYT